ncbi:TetR/AcrR family transcriptional regulator, partial [Staphylococcus aureus]|uniref:TetR/AcrR family transcriptional regulator n=1 Tax=Staphylococcus aureus TaxID=1280 RepID=UPI0039BE87CD
MTTRIPAPASTVRKAPRQARSRATIEAMLDATARILGERGWAGITTNAVAETAGVSIGSLYQYFPNKLALVEAVRQRHFDEVLAVLRAATDPEAPRARRVTAFVDGMIAAHGRYPAAHRALLE